MKTNFEKVVEFNKCFGLPHHDTPTPNVTRDDTKLTKLRLDLILEETRELQEANENHDFTEVVDALADILYVVYGAGSSFGVNLDEAFRLVHDSNMSKLCKSQEEAQATVDWYMENREKTGYDSPAYRKGTNGNYWVVYNESTGKILKSINYHPVEFSSIL